MGQNISGRPQQPVRLKPMLPLLLLSAMIGPLTINIVLPALPGIARTMATSRETVQLTISIYIATIAVGQLFIGPISDRFGRRPVMIICSAIYTLGGLWAAVVTSIEALVAARILQAIGATAGMSLARAVISDVSSRSETARILAYLTAVMVLAPMTAPLIGAWLESAFGWWSIFAFCAALGTAVFVLGILYLRETRPSSLVAATTRDIVRRSAGLLGNRTFLSYAGTTSATTEAYFAILGGAPPYVVETLQRTPKELGAWLILLGLGYAIGNLVAGRISVHFGSARMCSIGNLMMTLGALAMTAIALFDFAHPLALFLPAAAISFANGLVMPNATASAIQADPEAAGAASGLLGFMQMMLSATISFVVAWATEGTALPIALGVLFCGVMAMACLPQGFIPRSGSARPPR